MSIEVIPAGTSAVVSGNGGLKQVVRHAEAHIVDAVKDAEADSVRTVKDAEANLERSIGDKFINIVQDVKDAETRLNSAAADRFMQTIQDVKDAETRLNSAAADRFIWTTQDVKNTQTAVEASKAHLSDAIKDASYRAQSAEGHTRDYLASQFKSLAIESASGFGQLGKDVQVSLKEAQGLAYQNQMQTLLQFKD